MVSEKYPYNILVTYDVSTENEKIRLKIVDKLAEKNLHRLQYSVFLGYMTKNEVEMLSLELQDLIGDNDVDLRIFSLCRHKNDPEIVVSEYSPTTKSQIFSVRQHKKEKVTFY